MAIMTHFIATPASGKTLTLSALEALVVDLHRSRGVQLPAALFAGKAHYEPRYEEEENIEENQENIDREFAAFHIAAPQYIVPNAPETMIHFVERKQFSPETFWAYEREEQALLKALHRIPFGQQDICICFPFLNPLLQQSRWAGAAIYVLTHPAFIDFIHPTTYASIRLINHEISCFFTLASYRGASFSTSGAVEAKDFLQPILEKHFGDDVETAETLGNPL